MTPLNVVVPSQASQPASQRWDLGPLGNRSSACVTLGPLGTSDKWDLGPLGNRSSAFPTLARRELADAGRRGSRVGIYAFLTGESIGTNWADLAKHFANLTDEPRRSAASSTWVQIVNSKNAHFLKTNSLPHWAPTGNLRQMGSRPSGEPFVGISDPGQARTCGRVPYRRPYRHSLQASPLGRTGQI